MLIDFTKMSQLSTGTIDAVAKTISILTTQFLPDEHGHFFPCDEPIKERYKHDSTVSIQYTGTYSSVTNQNSFFDKGNA